jgi:phage/plasmid-associated DNA primase
LEVKKEGTVELLPFSPQFRSRNRSPIAYDPKATCPRFLGELLLPAVHPEDVPLIQKYLALSLLGRNLVQRFLVLDGTPGRGKSQLAIVFQNLVGLANCTQLRTEHLTGRFELSRFLKKTLLIGVDVPGDFLSTKGAQVLKALVGGDIMDAEQKGEKGCFPIEGTYCVVITSNSRLRVKLEGDADAWRRRLMIVRYEAPPVAKKIPDFGQHLIQTEGSGILNWALQGMPELFRDIEATGDIVLTPRQRGIVDALLTESDSLGHYLQDCVVKDAAGDLAVEELVTGYLQYCPTKGWVPIPTTVIQRRLEERMLELFQAAKSNSIVRDGICCRGFRHVRFRP